MKTIYRTPLLTACIGWLCLLSATSGQAQSPPPDTVVQRLILIGDAGRLHAGKNAVIDAVSSRYSLDNSRTTLLYLGDNSYPRGLPRKSSADYAEKEAVLRYQIAPGLGKQSNVLLIPGNHDWDKGGVDGYEAIRRQGNWLKALNAPNIRLIPADGCPGPVSLPLGKNMVLIVFDTQWALHPYLKTSSDVNCDCKNELEAQAQFTDLLYRNLNKAIVVATHHPFRSYGAHGGYYTLKQHLFPLTEFNEHLYVPLPIIGSIYPLGRGAFGNIQDLRHPLYRRIVNGVEKTAANTPNLVFVAGHDHGLQHIVDRERHYIVSGAGTNRDRVKKGALAEFVSSEWGYVVIEQASSGRVQAYFHMVEEMGRDSLAYTTLLMQTPMGKDTTASTSVQAPMWPATKTVAIAPRYDRFGHMHRQLLGENYRKLWATPVTLPVFDLSREKGGLEILQAGGGKQTRSLRLRDSTGREWVLRTVQKNPASALPPALQQTIARAIFQDQISASHPFGPLAVPVLAQAVGVPHANPTYVFIPDDPAFGEFQNEFANTVCLFEERTPDGTDKSISTDKVLEKLKADNDSQVDQRAVLRARLLDILIGDWDRHDDQWRWLKEKTKKGAIYSPVPRDRDQAFFRTQGLFPTIAGWSWLLPKFQGIRGKLSDVNGFNFNARYVDRSFLNELDQADWQTMTNAVRAAITDDVISQAVAQLPDTIQQVSGANLHALLLARQASLATESLNYYRFLAKTVDIPGSDKRELFAINHRSDGQTEVSVYKLKKDTTSGDRIYHRVFDPAITNEIRLYGRAGEDRFDVTGTPAKGLKVRLIGGPDNDFFNVAENNGPKNRTEIYDRSTEANTLPAAGLARIHTSPDTAINTYDRMAFRYDRLAPLISGAYNFDDGLRLGLGVVYTTQGFRKVPFASRHRLMIGQSFATSAFAIRYDGQFTKLIGNNNLLINVTSKAPSNTTNFFGIGNETVFEKSESRPIRYYRTRYDVVDVSVLLQRVVKPHVNVTLGPVFQYYNLNMADNQTRFISQYLQDGARPVDQDTRRFVGGLQAGITVDTRNNTVLPTRGVLWTSTLKGVQDLSDATNKMLQIRSDMSIYTSLQPANKVVMVNRIGGGVIWGEPAYYQLLYLGGTNNLRGFRNFRFAGDQMAYHNIELRIKLFDYNSFLSPGTVRLELFNDIGRVWANGMHSHTWHHGYGGGLSIAPLNRLIVRGLVGISKEGVMPYVNFGYQFQF